MATPEEICSEISENNTPLEGVEPAVPNRLDGLRIQIHGLAQVPLMGHSRGFRNPGGGMQEVSLKGVKNY